MALGAWAGISGFAGGASAIWALEALALGVELPALRTVKAGRNRPAVGAVVSAQGAFQNLEDGHGLCAQHDGLATLAALDV
jgi:hypothetical protein